MKLKILALALILAAPIAAARPQASAPAAAEADSVVLSLAECKEMALASNADIRSADNALRQAIETRREAFTKYFPEVQAAASIVHANHDMLQYTVLDLFTLGIIRNGRGAGIWALQPVFMGGRIINGNRLAATGERAARIQRDQSADAVALQTEALYWQLATLKAERHTLLSAIAALDTLARQVGVGVDAGVITRNDLLKVELKRNSFRSDLVDLNNGIELMRMLLSQQVGMGVDGRADIADVIPSDTVPPYPADIYLAPADALPRTNDHKLLEANVEARKLERRMEIGNYMPSVAVGGGWVYHNVFKQNHNFGAIMATVSVPISGWWGGSHAIRRKTLALENARIELSNLSEKLQIEMADKWDNLTAAYRKMLIAREAITQSTENLRLNRAYYEAGISTITELLDAQTLDRQAHDDYTAAYGAYRLSAAQYLSATGQQQPLPQ